ncbi:carbon dioxide-concentrating mechanism protein CcmK [Leptolyngbya sp. PCC 6406]|uniref:carbon dioxide-concentrating mechanism protein CcmK n=1 Tax=Leptolyngbya sp. PCC 6406 TaxID=1173264 RepID=UPI0002AC8EDF|nr:carbon dioxide-concentrating mechanism protein CcmK [Leptolyngbya sp. PCC 6406]
MPFAVGVIETQTFPAVLAAADAMVKAGRVTLVKYDRSESGRQFVAIRGPVSEVRQAMEAGLAAGNNMPNYGTVTSHYVVPNPPENLEAVLPIYFTEESEEFWIDEIRALIQP